MSSLVYLFGKTIKNWFRELKKNPGMCVLILIIAASLVFTIFSSLTVSPEELSMERRDVHELYAMLLALFAIIFCFLAFNGFRSGASFYSMADVNLLFATPISTRRILLYGLTKQLGISLFIGFFLLYQYSWLHSIYGVSFPQVLLILLGYGVMMFCGQLTAMLLYSLTSGNDRMKRIAKIVVAVLILLALAYLIIPLIQNQDNLLERAVLRANDPILYLFPVGGWVTAAVVGCLTGNLLAILAGFGGCLLFVAVILLILTKTRSDFYEDVLQATEVSHSALIAKREGTNTNIIPKHVKVGKTGIGKGWGPSVFFFKHRLENRRGRILLFDGLTMLFLAITIAFAFFVKDEGLLPILIFSTYMQLFGVAAGRWVQEFTLPYVYLVPASPFKKMLFLIAESFEKMIYESIFLYVVLGLIYQASIPELIFCALVRVSFGLLFIAGNVLTERLLGSSGKALILSFYFISMLILACIGLVLGLLLSYLATGTFLLIPVLAVILVWNTAASLLIFFLCRDMLSCAEINNK